MAGSMESSLMDLPQSAMKDEECRQLLKSKVAAERIRHELSLMLCTKYFYKKVVSLLDTYADIRLNLPLITSTHQFTDTTYCLALRQ